MATDPKKEEYERWLHDPERKRRGREVERNIGKAIFKAVFVLGLLAFGIYWWVTS